MPAWPRRGAAPLEFVIVFPLLLALTAGLFLIARADLSKEFAATDARHRAWDGRPTVPSGDPLSITADPADSVAARNTVKPVSSGPLFAGGFQAESRNAVFAHTWDHRAVPLAPGRPAFEPHLFELEMIAKQVPALMGILTTGLMVTTYLLDPNRDPLLRLLAAAGPAQNWLVRLAGDALRLIGIPTIQAAKSLIKLAMIPLRFAATFSRSARRLLRYLESVVNMMDIGVAAARNLYDATHGRPGHWDPNAVRRLGSFRP